MESFVDNFNDKRISTEVLHNMLKIQYQLDVLMELALKNYKSSIFEIEESNRYLRLWNANYLIFIVLSSDKETLKQIKNQISEIKERDFRIIVFDSTEKFNCLDNNVFIDSHEWMNRIISHGINRQILHLQFMRDMDFYYN